jgi:hypothetical protein
LQFLLSCAIRYELVSLGEMDLDEAFSPDFIERLRGIGGLVCYCEFETMQNFDRVHRRDADASIARLAMESSMTSNVELDDKIVELDRAREQSTAWLAKCITENGKPLPNLANAMIAIESIMPQVFAYDEMLRAPMLMTPLKPEDSFKPRIVRDVDIGIVQEKLQHLGLKRISKDTVHQAVDMRAHSRPFHPVRKYLDGLVWDEASRLAGFLPMYFGTAANDYTTKIGAMFMISMVARILDPGCKVDHMPAGHTEVDRLPRARRSVVLRQPARRQFR